MKDNGVHCENGNDWEFWFGGKLISTHPSRREANLALSVFDSTPKPTAQDRSVSWRIEFNPASGKWNLYLDGFYRAGFGTEAAAKVKLQKLLGTYREPEVSREDGVRQSPRTKRWHVWYKGTFYGVYEFELSARQKYSRIRNN